MGRKTQRQGRKWRGRRRKEWRTWRIRWREYECLGRGSGGGKRRRRGSIGRRGDRIAKRMRSSQRESMGGWVRPAWGRKRLGALRRSSNKLTLPRSNWIGRDNNQLLGRKGSGASTFSFGCWVLRTLQWAAFFLSCHSKGSSWDLACWHLVYTQPWPWDTERTGKDELTKEYTRRKRKLTEGMLVAVVEPWAEESGKERADEEVLWSW